MLRQLRWQIALAALGVLSIGAVLFLFANRGFEDRPARGGELVEAVVGRPAVLNPLLAVDDAELALSALLHCGLTRPDTDSSLRPDLATHWDVTPDGLTYTFSLREDAVWHDGAPVTASDVAFTAEMAEAIARDSSLAVGASPLVRPWERAEVEVVDEDTVAIHLSEPYGPFLDATSLGILPRHLLEGVRPEELGNHRVSRVEPVGCGPYRLDLPGGLDSASARLVRFDDHWDADDTKPYLDAVTLRFFPTVDAAVEALGSRTVQAMADVPAAALADLGDDVRWYSATKPDYMLVYLNNRDVLFSDPHLRRALSLSVDREAIAGDPELLDGEARASSDPIAPGSWAYLESADSVAYAPGEAEALLAEAGWIDSDGDGVRDRDGKPLRFTLGTWSDPRAQAIARRLGRDWSAIGIDAQVETLDQQTIVRALGARDYDAMLFEWELPQREPDPYPLWHSSQIESGQNLAAFANQDADDAMVGARTSAPSDSATDARLAHFQRFQEVFAEQQPSLVLAHPVFSYAVVDPNLGGVQLPSLLAQPADRYVTMPDWFVETERVFLGRSREG